MPTMQIMKASGLIGYHFWVTATKQIRDQHYLRITVIMSTMDKHIIRLAWIP
jgi:hypothetical protein